MVARLETIEVEAFRGFADNQLLDLGADVVLIRGDNGAGKTSLIDALIWLFCGELQHLAERVKGLRRTEDVVVNRYAGPPARVRLRLSIDGHSMDFERIGTADRNELRPLGQTSYKGDEAIALARALGHAGPLDLANAVRTWGVLRQDAVRAALESGGALHERLSGVVGLDRVTQFAASATAASKSLIRERTRLRKVRDELKARHEAAQQHLGRVREEAQVQPDPQHLLETAFRAFARTLPQGIAVTVDAPLSLDDLNRLSGEVSGATESAHLTAELFAANQAAEQAASVSVRDAEQELAAAKQLAEEFAQTSTPTEQLAASALDLLGDRCPVCGQAIDEQAVRERLLRVLGDLKEAATAAANARDAAARAEARLADARIVEERRSQAASAARESVRTLGDAIAHSSFLKVDSAWLNPDRIGDLLAALTQIAADLRRVIREAGRTSGGVLARAIEDVHAHELELAKVTQDLEEIEARCQRASALDKAAHKAAETIVRNALSKLEPSFAEVFYRLAPHPTFTELRARQDIYYGKNQVVPEVYDPERRISANPLVVYSEGQLNVVALSYFLGLALNAREGALPFMALDDPLQEMDVLSVLGFADLCRRIRDDRQLILTTHDRRFADVLTRKLAPRDSRTRTIVHDFEAWTREGPVVESREPPMAEVIPLLRNAV